MLKVDGLSQLPSGLDDSDMCVIVPCIASELVQSDLIVLEIDFSDNTSKSPIDGVTRYKFRAFDGLVNNPGCEILTHRYDQKQTKIASRPHNATKLLGRVVSKIRFNNE